MSEDTRHDYVVKGNQQKLYEASYSYENVTFICLPLDDTFPHVFLICFILLFMHKHPPSKVIQIINKKKQKKKRQRMKYQTEKQNSTWAFLAKINYIYGNPTKHLNFSIDIFFAWKHLVVVI